MRYFRALVLSASLFLPATSASANVLTPADYQSFQDLDVKMLSIGDDLYALITTRPEAHAPDCVMQLAFKFDAVQAVAASMTDNADELRVIRHLNLAAWGFVEQLKYHRLILRVSLAAVVKRTLAPKAKIFRVLGTMPLR